jgi:hypothetical protein
MSTSVTIWNVITGERQDVRAKPGQTVKQAVEESGIVAPGNFSLRDNDGNVVDHEMAESYNGAMLKIGPSGENIVGGNTRQAC